MKSSLHYDWRGARRFAAPAMAAGVLLACALSLAGFQEKAPASGDAAKPLPTGSIEGRVVDSGGGTPVKDVTLLLVKENGTGTPASIKTNEEGHFLFKDLDAGSYVLLGEHPRYARQTYGSRNGLLGGTLLTLATGQEMKDITFKLLPNGVASGKVLDPDGEPVAKVLVMALKGIYQHGKRDFIPVGTAVTNDLGEYRLGNLAAGRYIISANPMDPTAGLKPAEGEPETALLSGYYPNSPDAAGAAWVQVAAGGDAGGMDIRLGKAKSVHVKGKVSGDVKDQNVTVKLLPKNGGLMASIIGRSSPVKKADGTFDISGATQGSYILRASDQTGLKVLGAGMPIEIGDKPVEGSVLELGANGDLPGAVVVEDTDAKPVAGVALKGARIYLESMAGLTLMPPNTTVAEDGTFSLKEVPPDKYLVRLTNGPQGSYVESVRFGGQAMGEQGLDLAGGRGKLEIKLRLAGAEVAGVANGPDDNPISGVSVALIPDNGRYVLYQQTFTDQNGAFRFRGVTPGDYKLLAWEEVEPNAFMDAEFVKPFLGRAERVSLKASDHKAVTLKAIPRGQ